MQRLLQVIPKPGENLYGKMIAKEIALSDAERGTFFRSGRKQHNRAKWSHKAYRGWITLERSAGGVVTAEIQCLAERYQWQITQAFIGWIDRHFGNMILGINIQYP